MTTRNLISYFLFCTCALGVVSCTSQNSKDGDFDWLIGQWKRIGGYPNTETFETWKKSGDTYSAIAVNIEQGDTIYRENITLNKRDTTYHYTAFVPQDGSLTEYTLSQRGEYFFIARNQTNRWPLTISYQMQNDTLVAIISGSGRQIIYNFMKHETE